MVVSSHFSFHVPFHSTVRVSGMLWLTAAVPEPVVPVIVTV